MTVQKTTQVASRLRRETRARKARFDAAHAKGMKGFREGDYEAVGQAIREEGEILKESARALATSRRSLKKEKLKGTKR